MWKQQQDFACLALGLIMLTMPLRKFMSSYRVKTLRLPAARGYGRPLLRPQLSSQRKKLRNWASQRARDHALGTQHRGSSLSAPYRALTACKPPLMRPARPALRLLLPQLPPQYQRTRLLQLVTRAHRQLTLHKMLLTRNSLSLPLLFGHRLGHPRRTAAVPKLASRMKCISRVWVILVEVAKRQPMLWEKQLGAHRAMGWMAVKGWKNISSLVCQCRKWWSTSCCVWHLLLEETGTMICRCDMHASPAWAYMLVCRFAVVIVMP